MGKNRDSDSDSQKRSDKKRRRKSYSRSKSRSESDSEDSLDGLNEIQREEILQKRKEDEHQKQKLKKIQEQQKQKLKQQQNSKKLDEMNKKKRKMSSDSNSDDDSGSDYQRSSSQSRSRSRSRSRGDSLDKQQAKMKQEQELKRELQKITLTRQALENIIQKPNFSDLVKNCFVRVKSDLKDNYIFSAILKVEKKPTRYYKLENGLQTNLYLILQDGKQQKPTQVRYVSNNQISENEFTNWLEYQPANRISKKEINQILTNFNNQQNVVIDQEEIRKEKVLKIQDNLKKNVIMTRNDINFAIEIIEKSQTKCQNQIDELLDDHEEENKDVNLDKIKRLKKEIANHQDILNELEHKKKITKPDMIHSQKKHQFFRPVGSVREDQAKKSDKNKLKLEQRMKKLNQMNLAYMYDQEIKKKFQNYQEAENIKNQFQEIHSRELPEIEIVIQKWEVADFKELLQENQKAGYK